MKPKIHRSLPPLRGIEDPPVNQALDPSKYSTRLIALKFAYLGQCYNGLEYHPNSEKPLPTIEEELWKAFTKARLIFPTPGAQAEPGEINWEGCDYSKCGRTDKGVSAFGQVIGIRARSNRPLNLLHGSKANVNATSGGAGGAEVLNDTETQRSDLEPTIDNALAPSSREKPWTANSSHFDPVHDEIPYIKILNRLLPPDIRMLAWCPNPPPGFSARFSCKERRYRYFFTQPAFTPTYGARAFMKETAHVPSPEKRREGWLDIEAMRKAAKHFQGLHDFRNFCKVDAGKQITNFQRRIFYADIEEALLKSSSVGYVNSPGYEEYQTSMSTQESFDTRNNTSYPKVYSFTVHGSGFLWHQVRCMVAILFLIGQGLETPDLVLKLLDIQKCPQKPMYEMAEDAPLVLWDCVFQEPENKSREDAVEWIYVGDTHSTENQVLGKHGHGGVIDVTWGLWHRRKIEELLAGTLLDVVLQRGENLIKERENRENGMHGSKSERSQKVYLGGDSPRLAGNYIPVLSKPRMDSIETINSRYLARKASSHAK